MDFMVFVEKKILAYADNDVKDMSVTNFNGWEMKCIWSMFDNNIQKWGISHIDSKNCQAFKSA